MSLIEDYGYIEFEIIKEDWSEYLLEDKTLIRLKSIPLKGRKKDREVGFNLQKLLVAFVPDDLRGIPDAREYQPNELLNSIKKSDIPFKTIKEDWNEYKLRDGTKLSIKEVLSSASSTEKFDSAGEPIYIIQSQTNYKGFPIK